MKIMKKNIAVQFYRKKLKGLRQNNEQTRKKVSKGNKTKEKRTMVRKALRSKKNKTYPKNIFWHLPLLISQNLEKIYRKHS